MRTNPLHLAVGRVEGVIQIEEVCQGEGIIFRRKHLQSQYGRRILVRSHVLSFMIFETMLHGVHTRGEDEKGSTHYQQMLMTLHIGSKGRYFCSLPFQVLSPLSNKEKWLVDNIAYFHITGAREFFETLTATISD
jgi:hypothetical protein